MVLACRIYISPSNKIWKIEKSSEPTIKNLVKTRVPIEHSEFTLHYYSYSNNLGYKEDPVYIHSIWVRDHSTSLSLQIAWHFFDNTSNAAVSDKALFLRLRSFCSCLFSCFKRFISCLDTDLDSPVFDKNSTFHSAMWWGYSPGWWFYTLFYRWDAVRLRICYFCMVQYQNWTLFKKLLR